MVSVECMRDILKYMEEFAGGYAVRGNLHRDVNSKLGDNTYSESDIKDSTRKMIEVQLIEEAYNNTFFIKRTIYGNKIRSILDKEEGIEALKYYMNGDYINGNKLVMEYTKIKSEANRDNSIVNINIERVEQFNQNNANGMIEGAIIKNH